MDPYFVLSLCCMAAAGALLIPVLLLAAAHPTRQDDDDWLFQTDEDGWDNFDYIAAAELEDDWSDDGWH